MDARLEMDTVAADRTRHHQANRRAAADCKRMHGIWARTGNPVVARRLLSGRRSRLSGGRLSYRPFQRNRRIPRDRNALYPFDLPAVALLRIAERRGRGATPAVY